jgi:DNA-directed RNA polymerase subunit K/omega
MTAATDPQPEADETPGDAAERPAPPPSPPIDSRFLFVDVAAMRAKQLRRGAVPRLKQAGVDPATGHRFEMPHKLERVAMEEVRLGFIGYAHPEPKPQTEGHEPR